jgi:DNA-directed RNA polymerase subunit RPC12/RpoP
MSHMSELAIEQLNAEKTIECYNCGLQDGSGMCNGECDNCPTCGTDVMEQEEIDEIRAGGN